MAQCEQLEHIGAMIVVGSGKGGVTFDIKEESNEGET